MNNTALANKLREDYRYTFLDKPLGFQGVTASMNFRQSAYEGGKVVSLTRQPSLPPEDILATGWAVQGSNPGGGEIFHNRPGRPEAHPASCLMGIGVFLPGIKLLGCGLDTLRPSSVEFKERV
jgi:hypothetical protein